MASIEKRDDRPARPWLVRWREPDGRQRSRSFDKKRDADSFFAKVNHELRDGSYIDPAAGQETFGAYAARWVAMQTWRPSTEQRIASVLDRQVLPHLGDKPLRVIRPSTLQSWVTKLRDDGLAPSTVTGSYRLVASILRAAVIDRLIAESPARGVRLPRAERTHGALAPLTVDEVHRLAAAMPDRLERLVLVAAGLGLRQGEACGLSVDRVDFLRRQVRIDRQLVTNRGGPTFGPPKTAASNRVIPLPDEVGVLLAEQLRMFGPGRDQLIFTLDDGRPIPRNRLADSFNRATKAAEVDVTFHALRHFAASALISAGASVKAVQAFLGHATAGETLDTYGHLWPSDDDTIRAAIDALLSTSSRPAV